MVVHLSIVVASLTFNQIICKTGEITSSDSIGEPRWMDVFSTGKRNCNPNVKVMTRINSCGPSGIHLTLTENAINVCW